MRGSTLTACRTSLLGESSVIQWRDFAQKRQRAQRASAGVLPLPAGEGWRVRENSSLHRSPLRLLAVPRFRGALPQPGPLSLGV